MSGTIRLRAWAHWGCEMQDDLSRAQHYRVMAEQMQETAAKESNVRLRINLLKLADQYGRLAEKLIGRHHGETD